MAGLATVVILALFEMVIFAGYMGILIAGYRRQRRMLVNGIQRRFEKNVGDKAV